VSHTRGKLGMMERRPLPGLFWSTASPVEDLTLLHDPEKNLALIWKMRGSARTLFGDVHRLEFWMWICYMLRLLAGPMRRKIFTRRTISVWLWP